MVGLNWRLCQQVVLAFTLFDAEDASNNPGPNIGSRVQITRAGLQSVQRIVNWTLLPIGVE